MASPSSIWEPTGRELFRQLFPPGARQALLASRRVILSPEGFLWDVPFAALVINEESPPRCLGIEKPLTYAQSLTLFCQSLTDKSHSVPTGQPSALVVGHPLFDR